MVEITALLSNLSHKTGKPCLFSPRLNFSRNRLKQERQEWRREEREERDLKTATGEEDEICLAFSRAISRLFSLNAFSRAFSKALFRLISFNVFSTAISVLFLNAAIS
jgi:hypothetical protein